VAQEAVTAHTAAGTALGTPSYMPPEQFADASHVDLRADIFSLGATLYQMLAGQPPFRGDTFHEIMKQVEEADPGPLPGHVPAEVQGLVAYMLAKRPERRLQTYDELIAAMQKAQHALGETEEHVIQKIATVAMPTTIPELKAGGKTVRPAT